MIIQNESGIIGISNSAIASLACRAASECFGVLGLGKTKNLISMLTSKPEDSAIITKTDDDKIAVELHIAMQSGLNMNQLCLSIINEVKYKLRQQLGDVIDSVTVCVDELR